MSIGLHRKALFWPNASGDFSMIQHRALAISQLQMEQPPTDRLQKKKSCLKVGKSALIPMVVCILSITKIRQENFPNNYIRTKFTLFIFSRLHNGKILERKEKRLPIFLICPCHKDGKSSIHQREQYTLLITIQRRLRFKIHENQMASMGCPQPMKGHSAGSWLNSDTYVFTTPCPVI